MGWRRRDSWVLFCLFAGGLIICLAVGRDFGASWDEVDTAVLGQRTLQAYSGSTPDDEYKNSSLYGPVYLAFSELTASAISETLPGWTMADGRHAAYFLSFLMAIGAVYVITQGIAGTWPALAASVLMGTQPLLLGHAFINPKDVPFMGLFAVAVAAGIALARSLPLSAEIAGSTTPTPLIEARREWGTATWRVRTRAHLDRGVRAVVFLGVRTTAAAQPRGCSKGCDRGVSWAGDCDRTNGFHSCCDGSLEDGPECLPREGRRPIQGCHSLDRPGSSHRCRCDLVVAASAELAPPCIPTHGCWVPNRPGGFHSRCRSRCGVPRQRTRCLSTAWICSSFAGDLLDRGYSYDVSYLAVLVGRSVGCEFAEPGHNDPFSMGSASPLSRCIGRGWGPSLDFRAGTLRNSAYPSRDRIGLGRCIRAWPASIEG